MPVVRSPLYCPKHGRQTARMHGHRICWPCWVEKYAVALGHGRDGMRQVAR